MSDFWNATYEVARKEVLQHIRTKRLLIIGSLLLVTLWLLTVILPLWVFDANDGPVQAAEPAGENAAFFFYMSASIFGGSFFLQLLAIVLTADAVCSEWQNRTIFLLLSKPVSRAAFVLGKFVGSVAAIVPAVAILFSLQYAILQPLWDGSPTGEEVWRFFGFVGIVCLAAIAVSSVALFFSTLTKSTVQSLVLTLVTVFVVFPLLGNIGDFAYFADANNRGSDQLDQSDFKYDWSHYLSPERTFTTASDVLLDGEESDTFSVSFLIPQFPAQIPWLSIVSGAVFVVLFTTASILVVRRRNFE